MITMMNIMLKVKIIRKKLFKKNNKEKQKKEKTRVHMNDHS